MNRQKAMEYDENLSRELQDFAGSCEENKETAKNIVDHFIEFIPDDEPPSTPLCLGLCPPSLLSVFITFLLQNT